MVPRIGPHWSTTAVIVCVNALPLVGVLGLGWDVTMLVTLYCLESGVVLVWSLVRAAFAGNPAQQDPDLLIIGALVTKRVSLSIPGTGLRLWLSNLIGAATAAVILPGLWLIVVAAPLAIVNADDLGTDAWTSVLLATTGIALVTGGRTLVDYFLRGEYRDHHAGTVLRGAFIRLAGLLIGTLLVVLTVGAATGGPNQTIGDLDPTVVGGSLLALIVIGKLAVDLAVRYRDTLIAAYREHINDFDEPPISLEPSAQPYEPVETALQGAVTRVRATPRARLLGWPVVAIRHSNLWVLAVLAIIAAPLLGLAGAWTLLGLVLVGVTVLSTTLLAVDYWLRYGFVEYRVGDSAVVAVDRLFRTPLWRVEAWDEQELRVERGRIDGLLGTETLVIDLPDRTHTLPGLEDATPILQAFDRRAEWPEGE